MHRANSEDVSQMAEVVAERIGSLIVDGVLKPGQASPSERRLTVKLDAPRFAVREGLKGACRLLQEARSVQLLRSGHRQSF
jgi:GntR family transcriptional activator of glc operon